MCLVFAYIATDVLLDWLAFADIATPVLFDWLVFPYIATDLLLCNFCVQYIATGGYRYQIQGVISVGTVDSVQP